MGLASVFYRHETASINAIDATGEDSADGRAAELEEPIGGAVAAVDRKNAAPELRLSSREHSWPAGKQLPRE